VACHLFTYSGDMCGLNLTDRFQVKVLRVRKQGHPQAFFPGEGKIFKEWGEAEKIHFMRPRFGLFAEHKIIEIHELQKF
jgi:hypothetical protein